MQILLRGAEVDGATVDVTIRHGRIVARPSAAPDEVIDAGGGALIGGLHDHHLHLLAMAAADHSLDLATATDPASFDEALAIRPGTLAGGGWLRAVGYDDQVHGPLDRRRLDHLAPDRPVRVQHRSGALWVLNSRALTELGVDADRPGHPGFPGRPDRPGPPGLPHPEADDLADGRLFRSDEWLRDRLPPPPPPDLAAVGRRLASYGITGVTDATPTADPAHHRLLADAVRSGALPQQVIVMGGPPLAEADPPPPLTKGPVKVVIADHALPPLADLEQWFRRAHRAGRPVAVHCVTRVALALAVAAWDEVGSLPGDRVEHASVTSPDLAIRLHEHGLTVATQPAFVAARGDRYLATVDPVDRPDLYRCATLLAAGAPVLGSSDAPYGPEDPWIAIRAAVERRTGSGVPIGPGEALRPDQALALYAPPPAAPAGLVLLDAPLAEVLADPRKERVVRTFCAPPT